MACILFFLSAKMYSAADPDVADQRPVYSWLVRFYGLVARQLVRWLIRNCICSVHSAKSTVIKHFAHIQNENFFCRTSNSRISPKLPVDETLPLSHSEQTDMRRVHNAINRGVTIFLLVFIDSIVECCEKPARPDKRNRNAMLMLTQ